MAAAAIAIAWALEAAWQLFGGRAATPIKWVSLTATVIATPLAGAAGWMWRRLWRWFPWLERNTFPDLTGVWQGKVSSTWSKDGDERVSPVDATFLIRQGLFFISIKTQTGESSSYSTRAILEPDRDAQRFKVWYSYENSPAAGVMDRSSRHEGVAWLEMDYEHDRNKLVGQYFTHRQTTGDIELRRTSREIKQANTKAKRRRDA